MVARISPRGALRGTIRVPGDKSISHRYAMLAAVSEVDVTIHNYSTGADCQSTLGVLAALGVPIEQQGTTVRIRGQGLKGFRTPATILDAGNSGTTIRLITGLLAGQNFSCQITGDASLRRRPMDRIVEPLRRMGGQILARDGRYPPLEIHGRPLHAIEYHLPVASAQVKSCVLLAGLLADGLTTVVEPVPTRDHTEIALREFGAEIQRDGQRIVVKGSPRLRPPEQLHVPGDLSSAAFWLVAATIVPNSYLVIEQVGLNPTRAALLDFLQSMGARIRVLHLEQRHGELVGHVEVQSAPVRGGVIEGALTAQLIDEIPVLAVLGAVSQNGLTVRNAAELRVKESDRIATVAENLRAMGAQVEIWEDGFHVPGKQRLRGGTVNSCGDHRIAMAFAVAGLVAEAETEIVGAEAANVSYPGFFDALQALLPR